MNLQIFREVGDLLGREIVKLSCSCGFSTDTVLADCEDRIKRDMEKHWCADHPAELDELGKGPCGVCGELTDHLKIRSELGDGRRVYVCAAHAPAHRLRALFGGEQ